MIVGEKPSLFGEKKRTRRNHKENGSQKMGAQKQENRRSWKAEKRRGEKEMQIKITLEF